MISNPFRKRCVVSINLKATRNAINENEILVHGYIHFRNGNTLGKQYIEAKNLAELSNKIEEFINKELP